jgi:hypothetical protein
MQFAFRSVAFAGVVLSSAFVTTVSLADETRVNPQNAERIDFLKGSLRKIATDNLGNRDNLASIRAQLEPMAQELASFYTSPGLEAEIPTLTGAWKEIFSDDVEPEPPGFSTDRDQTFQVITDKGYFYNLANLKGFVTVLGVLRGVYTQASDNFLNIEFTKVSIRPKGLKPEENLDGLVSSLESGETFTIAPPGDNRAPKGPVGAKGNIKNIYLDSNFRVATGSNFADGKYDLYILDKVTTPVKYK